MTSRSLPRAVAVAAALWLSATACSDGARRPSATGTPGAVTSRPTALPSEAEVRAAAAGYLAAVGAEVVSVNVEKDHLGLYVRGNPAWTLDQYVAQLPAAAEATRELLVRFPALGDVDICADGPWLPHPDGVAFVPAVRVQIFRPRLAELPARFTSPAQVIGLGLREPHLVEHYLENRIRNESAAYQEAYRNAGAAAKTG